MRSIIFSLATLMLLMISCTSKNKTPDTTDATVSIKKQGHIKSNDDISFFYQLKGTGKDTLVVIHGGPGMDSEYMVADFVALEKDYTLLYYDQRGGGRSDLPDDTDKLHIDNHIADLEALREYFDIKQMNLVAHSFGPMIAAKYAIKHPTRVSKMIFMGPVPPMQGDFGARYGANLNSKLSTEQQQEMNAHFQELIQGEDIKAGCKNYWNIALIPRLAEGLPVSIVKGDCCAAPAEAIRYGMQVTNAATFGSLGNWDLRPQLVDLDIPTLVLHGEQEAIPMDMVEEWSDILPNANLIKVPDAGHFTYAERPDIVWPAVKRFLNN